MSTRETVNPITREDYQILNLEKKKRELEAKNDQLEFEVANPPASGIDPADLYNVVMTSTKDVIGGLICNFRSEYKNPGGSIQAYANDGIAKVLKDTQYTVSVFGGQVGQLTDYSVKFWLGGVGGTLVDTIADLVTTWSRFAEINIDCPVGEFDTIQIVANV